jgi:DNA-binding NarL/FixJ family response regulator
MGAKAVIIDHEPLMAAQLKKLLQQGKPAIEVKAICYEGEQAMACLAAHQPDIVFLTLEMPRVSGMIIAKQIEAEKRASSGHRLCHGPARFHFSDAAAQCPRLSGQAGYGR